MSWNTMLMKGAVLTVFFGISAVGTAQPLAEFEAMAAEQNPLLRSLMLEYQAILEREDQVSVWPGVQVGAAIPVLTPETRLGSQHLMVSASQMFPWFGEKQAKKDIVLPMSKERYEAAREAQLALNYELRVAYLRLFSIDRKQEIIGRNIEIFQALERMALSRVESGKADLSDVLQIQLKQRELESRVALLESEKAGYTATINKVSGREAESPVEVVDSFGLDFFEGSVDSVLAVVRDQHPSLLRLDWMYEASEKRSTARELSGRPSFGFGVDYALITPRSDMDPVNNGRDVLIPKIMATIPLQRKQRAAGLREEELMRSAIDEKRTWALDQLEEQAILMLDDFRKAGIEAELIARQRELAVSAVEVLLSAYSAEGRKFDELLRLEERLLQLDERMIEIAVASGIARARLDRLTGSNETLTPSK